MGLQKCPVTPVSSPVHFDDVLAVILTKINHGSGFGPTLAVAVLYSYNLTRVKQRKFAFRHSILCFLLELPNFLQPLFNFIALLRDQLVSLCRQTVPDVVTKDDLCR